MGNQAKSVVVGKPSLSGGVFVAPSGTAIPKSESTALSAAYKSPGYITSDGVTRSIGRDQSELVAWGGDVVRKSTTKHDLTYKLSLMETNGLSAAIVYGADNVDVTDATAAAGNKLAIRITADDLPHGVVVLQIKDGDRVGRIVLPDAQVGEIGDVSYRDEDAVVYEVTYTAYPDADGVKAYEFWDDGQKLAA